jgi:hypothetical protein
MHMEQEPFTNPQLGLLDHDVLKELRICIPLVSHMQNILLQSLSPCLLSVHMLKTKDVPALPQDSRSHKALEIFLLSG